MAFRRRAGSRWWNPSVSAGSYDPGCASSMSAAAWGAADFHLAARYKAEVFGDSPHASRGPGLQSPHACGASATKTSPIESMPLVRPGAVTLTSPRSTCSAHERAAAEGSGRTWISPWFFARSSHADARWRGSCPPQRRVPAPWNGRGRSRDPRRRSGTTGTPGPQGGPPFARSIAETTRRSSRGHPEALSGRGLPAPRPRCRPRRATAREALCPLIRWSSAEGCGRWSDHCGTLRSLRARGRDAFLSDEVVQDRAERHAQLLAQACADIALHILRGNRRR